MSRRRLLVGLALAALVVGAVLTTRSAWTAQPSWTLDGLFYESQTRELTGTAPAKAREEVFFGEIGDQVPEGARDRVHDREWIEYSADFYRRRWVAPALAAAIKPAFGDRSLQLVSLCGYVLASLLIYALARRRFGVAGSLAGAAFAVWLPIMREFAAHPLTDSLGVAVLALTLIAAWWASRGEGWRVAVWAAAVLLLALTRDVAVVAVAAAAGLALVTRTRRSLALVGAGVLAALPVPLIFGAPLQRQLAFTFSGNRVPDETRWSFIASRWKPSVGTMIEEYGFGTHWVAALLLVALVCVVAWRPAAASQQRIRQIALIAGAAAAIATALFAEDQLPAGVVLIVALLPLAIPADRDPFIALARGGAIGALLYLLLIPIGTDMRYPMILVPFAALGVARAVEVMVAPAQRLDSPA